ncbi:hypothetical protein ULMS_00090 [Patiriisocius marinistellae]|uniref:Aspartyl/asparaginy/proline hydroxylase domain-containing protein n=1 Tax=Patiriisocius marinistellae TaxID=2494560 RepID=A0A5J4FXV6_9FLAO|nr:aspartyl/asparaginyl beta-hydroxylase domain-containing protein [Patiriisocius marinistellae]GEQ84501.1 hypothetical protein ULMS_00090 [Patiriisocius marinistellae]
MNNNAIKLPFHFSEELLLNDLKYCKSLEFVKHYSTDNYVGNWNSISLRSIDGLPQNIKAFDPMNDNWVDTYLLDHCFYFKEIIDLFKCDKYAIRLLNLAPNSRIKEHTDHNLGYSDGVFRVHVPIATNNRVQFVIGGAQVPMRVGECWYGDFNVSHSVCNLGNTERVHLTMDCKRNEWSDSMFKNSGYDFDLENKIEIYDDVTKRSMIASLQEMDTDVARALIIKLQNELRE